MERYCITVPPSPDIIWGKFGIKKWKRPSIVWFKAYFYNLNRLGARQADECTDGQTDTAKAKCCASLRCAATNYKDVGKLLQPRTIHQH